MTMKLTTQLIISALLAMLLTVVITKETWGAIVCGASTAFGVWIFKKIEQYQQRRKDRLTKR
jgi:hypothetical protein